MAWISLGEMVSCVVAPDWIKGRVAMNAPALPPESVHRTVQVHSQLALPLTALSSLSLDYLQPITIRDHFPYPNSIFLMPKWFHTTRCFSQHPKIAQSLPDMFWSRPKLARLVPDFAPSQNISNGRVVISRAVPVRTCPYMAVQPSPLFAHSPICSSRFF